MRYGTEIVCLALFAFLALVAAGFAMDEPFRLHMGLLFVILTVSTVVLLRKSRFQPAAPVDPDA